MRIKFMGLRFRTTTLLALGAGFLLGSRAGRGPWESVVSKISQYQGRHGADVYSGNGSAPAPASQPGEVDVRSKSVPFTEI